MQQNALQNVKFLMKSFIFCFYDTFSSRCFSMKQFSLANMECYVEQIPASNYLHKDFTFILLSHLYIKSEHAFDVI